MLFSDMPPIPDITFDLREILSRFFNYIYYVFDWLDSVKVNVFGSATFSLLDFSLACLTLATVFATLMPPTIRDRESGDLLLDNIYDDDDDDNEAFYN